MNKLFKSTLVVGLISFVIVACLVIGLVCTNQQKVHWENKAEEYNLSHWNSLLMVLEQMDRNEYTLDTVKQFAPRVNVLCQFSYTPNMVGSKTASSFLGAYYDPFVQMIATEKLSQQELEESLVLLETMNKEFLSLLQDVLPSNEQEKGELLNGESDTYKNAQQKIIAFCDTYTQQIAPYVKG